MVLAWLYPDAHCAFDFRSPLELLDCDDPVGSVHRRPRFDFTTPALFARYPDAVAYAQAELGDIETLIRSTGFFRNKAKSIRDCCGILVERHGGQVPSTLEELVVLPGVGRKTANVVLGNAFETPGITVDTHVGRLSRRLGFTKHEDAVKVEHDLMAIWPRKEWTMASHRLIFHGRQVCHSRKPLCDACALAKLCPKVGVVFPSPQRKQG